MGWFLHTFGGLFAAPSKGSNLLRLRIQFCIIFPRNIENLLAGIFRVGWFLHTFGGHFSAPSKDRFFLRLRIQKRLIFPRNIENLLAGILGVVWLEFFM